jgi:membrane-associated phospholipid phosphatase
MKKTFGGIRVYWILLVVLLALIGIFFGSLYDLDISQAIADPNDGFAKFFEGFGETLGYALVPISCTLIFMGLKDDHPLWLKIIGWAVLIMGIAIPTYILGDAAMSEYSFGLKAYVAFPISFVVMALSSMLTYFVAGFEDKAMLIRVGLAVLAAMLVQLAVLYVLKQIGSRPRFRYLIDPTKNTTGEIFREWWQFGINLSSFSKADDYHRSWPSGHTATASMALLLPLLGRARKNKLFAHQDLILFLIGLLYTLVVAFARIRAGAHFLSDVSFALLIGTGIDFLAMYFGFREKKAKPQTEQKA